MWDDDLWLTHAVCGSSIFIRWNSGKREGMFYGRAILFVCAVEDTGYKGMMFRDGGAQELRCRVSQDTL